jgi:hypothetical protein
MGGMPEVNNQVDGAPVNVGADLSDPGRREEA